MANQEAAAQLGHPGEREPFKKCKFEVDPFMCRLWGYIRAEVYEETDEGEHDLTTIIRCDEEWHVKVHWWLEGKLRHHLCGEFCICVSLESIGPGPDYRLPVTPEGEHCVRVDMDPCGDGHYDLDITIPPDTIDCGECGTLYELAITLTSFDKCDPPHPGHLAAYCKGPTLMFYEPPHQDD